MTEYSRELLQYDEIREVENEQERYKNLLSSYYENVDLHLVLNRHGDAADARRSVGAVTPHSVVFIESCYIGEQGESPLRASLEHLAYERILHGFESEEYEESKQRLLEQVAPRVMAPAERYNDFSSHQAEEIKCLLEMDCLILVADYSSHVDGEISSNFDQTADYFKQDEYPDVEALLSEHAGMARSIQAYNDLLLNEQKTFIMHHLRERRAVGEAGIWLNKIKAYIEDAELQTDENGRLPVYLIYGAAHRDSLLYNFRSLANIDPTLHELVALHPSEYIKPDLEAFEKNSFQALAWNALLDSPFAAYGTGELKYRTLDRLERFNGESGELYRFVLSCLSITRKVLKATPDEYSKIGTEMQQIMLAHGILDVTDLQ